MRSKKWCFTLNNYTAQEEGVLVAAQQDGQLGVQYLCYGREVGDSGTPHLQGFAYFLAPVTFSTAKSRLGVGRIHIERARGTPQQAIAYCEKDGNFNEYGERPQPAQGRRSDLEEVFHWADGFAQENGRPPTLAELAREHPIPTTKFPRLLDIIQARYEGPALEAGTPRQWQQELADELDGLADDRSIRFVVDQEGGKGKSWFVRWYLSNNDGIVQKFSVSKRDDIAHGIEIQTKIFFIDVPRGQMEFLNYSIMEMMKDRLVWSPKYHSQQKRLLNKVHVVVFSNEWPDMNKLTPDRYKITEL